MNKAFSIWTRTLEVNHMLIPNEGVTRIVMTRYAGAEISYVLVGYQCTKAMFNNGLSFFPTVKTYQIL